MCLCVNTAGCKLGIPDRLSGVYAIVAGEQVSQGNGQQQVRHSFKTEQLKADEQCSERASRDAAENAGHADCGTQSRILTGEISKEIAKGRSDKKAWYDLAAFVFCGQRHNGEEDL